MREEVAKEGMAEPAEDIEAAATAAWTAMEAGLRPMARLLMGQRPEGAKTVLEPTEQDWWTPRDTCAEEEEGTDDGTDDTEEG